MLSVTCEPVCTKHIKRATLTRPFSRRHSRVSCYIQEQKRLEKEERDAEAKRKEELAFAKQVAAKRKIVEEQEIRQAEVILNIDRSINPVWIRVVIGIDVPRSISRNP